MASIKNTISITGTPSAFYIVALYSAAAPGAELSRVVYTNGVSPNPFQFEFTGLAAGTYIVKVHASSDGTTLGTLRHDYWIDAQSDINNVLERRFFTVGGASPAPAAGASSFIDTSLLGANIIEVFKEAFRPLETGVEWNARPGGGFDLIPPFYFGSDGEVWSYLIQYTVTTTATSPNDPFATIVEQAAATVTLSASDLNKTHLCGTSGPTQVVTLPAAAGITEGKGAVFIHDGGGNVNVKITGGTIRWRGRDLSSFYLATGETVKIIRSAVSGTAIWHVIEYEGHYRRIGEVVGVYKLGDNMLICDGATLYDGANYPRIWEYLLNELPADRKKNPTDWSLTSSIDGETVAVNKGFWMVDIINQQFRTPDLRNLSRRFIKNVGGADTDRVENVPGGYQHHKVGAHAHNGLTGENAGHGGSSSASTSSVLRFLVTTAAGLVGSFFNAFTGTYNTGKETTVRNFAEIPAVLI